MPKIIADTHAAMRRITPIVSGISGLLSDVVASPLADPAPTSTIRWFVPRQKTMSSCN
jgi:hypothetical protein